MEEFDDKETLDEIRETQEQSKEDFKSKLNKKKLSDRDLDTLFSE